MEWVIFSRTNQQKIKNKETIKLRNKHTTILQSIGDVEYPVLKHATVRKPQKRILLLKPIGLVDFRDKPRNSKRVNKRILKKLHLYDQIQKVCVSQSVLSLTYIDNIKKSYESNGDYTVMHLATEIGERCQAKLNPTSLSEKKQLFSQDFANFSNFSLSNTFLDLFEPEVETKRISMTNLINTTFEGFGYFVKSGSDSRGSSEDSQDSEYSEDESSRGSVTEQSTNQKLESSSSGESSTSDSDSDSEKKRKTDQAKEDNTWSFGHSLLKPIKGLDYGDDYEEEGWLISGKKSVSHSSEYFCSSDDLDSDSDELSHQKKQGKRA